MTSGFFRPTTRKRRETYDTNPQGSYYSPDPGGGTPPGGPPSGPPGGGGSVKTQRKYIMGFSNDVDPGANLHYRMDITKTLGLGWIRATDVTADTYNGGTLKRITNYAHSIGLKVLWPMSHTTYAGKDPNVDALLAIDACNNQGVDAIEYGSKINLSQYNGEVNPDNYADMLASFATTFKANTASVMKFLVMGSLGTISFPRPKLVNTNGNSWDANSWVNRMIVHNGHCMDKIDGIGIAVINYDRRPQNTSYGVHNQLSQIILNPQFVGVNVPFWVTEIACPFPQALDFLHTPQDQHVQAVFDMLDVQRGVNNVKIGPVFYANCTTNAADIRYQSTPEVGFSTPPWAVYENPNGITGSDTSYRARVDRMVDDLHAKHIRMDTIPTALRTTPEMDNMINYAYARGMKVTCCLVQGAGGANSYGQVGGIAAAVTTVLNRWGLPGQSKIHAIQIGNEINAGNMDPNFSGQNKPGGLDPNDRGGPEAYPPIIKAAFTTAQAINPEILVIIGAVCAHGTNDAFGLQPGLWMQRMVAAAGPYKVGGKFPWHGGSYHAYSSKTDASVNPVTNAFHGGIPGGQEVHDAMANAGDPGFLMNTEAGWYFDAANAGSIPGNFTLILNAWFAKTWAANFDIFTFDGDITTGPTNDQYRAGIIDANDGTNIATVPARAWYGTVQGIAAATTNLDLGAFDDVTRAYRLLAGTIASEGNKIMQVNPLTLK